QGSSSASGRGTSNTAAGGIAWCCHDEGHPARQSVRQGVDPARPDQYPPNRYRPRRSREGGCCQLQDRQAEQTGESGMTIARLQKVTLCGLIDDKGSILTALQQAGCVHVVPLREVGPLEPANAGALRRGASAYRHLNEAPRQ